MSFRCNNGCGGISLLLLLVLLFLSFDVDNDDDDDDDDDDDFFLPPYFFNHFLVSFSNCLYNFSSNRNSDAA